jgi:hypothetical protein
MFLKSFDVNLYHSFEKHIDIISLSFEPIITASVLQNVDRETLPTGSLVSRPLGIPISCAHFGTIIWPPENPETWKRYEKLKDSFMKHPNEPLVVEFDKVKNEHRRLFNCIVDVEKTLSQFIEKQNKHCVEFRPRKMINNTIEEEQILKRANQYLKSTDYNFLSNNCQHIATGISVEHKFSFGIATATTLIMNKCICRFVIYFLMLNIATLSLPYVSQFSNIFALSFVDWSPNWIAWKYRSLVSLIWIPLFNYFGFLWANGLQTKLFPFKVTLIIYLILSLSTGFQLTVLQKYHRWICLSFDIALILALRSGMFNPYIVTDDQFLVREKLRRNHHATFVKRKLWQIPCIMVRVTSDVLFVIILFWIVLHFELILIRFIGGNYLNFFFKYLIRIAADSIVYIGVISTAIYYVKHNV